MRNNITRLEALEQVARPNNGGLPWLTVCFDEADDEAVRKSKRDAIGYNPERYNLIQRTIIRPPGETGG